MDQGLVSIVIPSYNGVEHLRKCLPSVYKQKYKNIEVIIVDNNSKDTTLDFVSTHFPKAKLIQSKSNLGFAEANNVGYHAAKGKFILLLNNDTIVSPDFLTILVKSLLTKKYLGAVQPKIFLIDKPTILDSVGAYLTASGLLYHFGVNRRNSAIYNKKRYIYSAKGACLLIKREALEAALLNGDPFDPEYFAYFEETDLCHRLWLAGYRVMFEPKAVILHKMGATSSKLQNSFIQFHSFKNRFNTYIKNLSVGNLLPILIIHFIITEAYSIVALLRLNLGLFLAIQNALLWNVLNLKRTLIKRSFIQSNIRAVSDKSIWKFIYVNPRFSYYFNLESGLEFFKD